LRQESEQVQSRSTEQGPLMARDFIGTGTKYNYEHVH